MKLVARLAPALVIAALALSCHVDTTAPDRALSLHRSGNDGGNPACRLGRGERRGPVDFLCAIEIPSPLTGSQKGWAEQSNAKYFLSDASASGAHVIDIRTHTYVGLIGGMTGAATTGGGTATTNGPGPNAFVSAPAHGGFGHGDDDDDDRRGADRVLFVSDGNSTVHVVDMDRLRIVTSVSTAMAECDGGTATTKYCGRSNEIAYDPVHHIVAVSNPSPLAVAAPHGPLEGYLTFISARSPYRVLGHLSFGAGTVEGHIWVPQLNRFLLPMQNPPGGPFIAVINAKTRQVEDRRVYNCAAIPGAVPTSGGNNNLQMGPGDNLWAQLCGRPMRLDVRTGAVRNVVEGISTGDQDWFNPGDGNFYWTGTPTGGVASLGVANARTGAFLQAVPNIGGASPSAYARTNEIFTRVPFTAANDPNSRCVVKGKGCVVVFAHTGTADEDD